MLDVNEYFDGNVKSIGFQAETMTVVSGALTVKLPDSDGWVRFDAGSSFEVEADQKFQLKVAVDTAYLCTYE